MSRLSNYLVCVCVVTGGEYSWLVGEFGMKKGEELVVIIWCWFHRVRVSEFFGYLPTLARVVCASSANDYTS